MSEAGLNNCFFPFSFLYLVIKPNKFMGINREIAKVVNYVKMEDEDYLMCFFGDQKV
jgi:hypothetical protein